MFRVMVWLWTGGHLEFSCTRCWPAILPSMMMIPWQPTKKFLQGRLNSPHTSQPLPETSSGNFSRQGIMAVLCSKLQITVHQAGPFSLRHFPDPRSSFYIPRGQESELLCGLTGGPYQTAREPCRWSARYQKSCMVQGD